MPNQPIIRLITFVSRFEHYEHEFVINSYLILITSVVNYDVMSANLEWKILPPVPYGPRHGDQNTTLTSLFYKNIY
jgi:hypothetical protein